MTKDSWLTCTVQDFIDKGEAEVKTGPFGTQLHTSDYVETGTPVINARNIGFGEMRVEKLEFISDETVQRLSSHLLEPSDIVFGRKGTVERHVFVQPEQANWFQGTDCLRLRFKSPSIEPRFVSYCLLTEEHKQWIMNQSSHGATMTSLNQAIIGRISLQLPPLPIQRRIASILSAYDDLIENNTRRIKILEQMAQAIYREWFVEFRAPGVQLRKATSNEKKVTGKDRFPVGWVLKQLGDVIELAYGKALRADTRTPGPIPVYGSAGVIGYHNESLVAGPGIIVGRKGNVGSVFWSDEDFFPIDTVFYVVTELSLHYIYYNLQSQNFINNDAAVPGLSRNQAYLNPFVVPAPESSNTFGEFIKPLFEQIQNLAKKNANLRQTRDLLLPRLVTGQVDVTGLDTRTGA